MYNVCMYVLVEAMTRRVYRLWSHVLCTPVFTLGSVYVGAHQAGSIPQVGVRSNCKIRFLHDPGDRAKPYRPQPTNTHIRARNAKKLSRRGTSTSPILTSYCLSTAAPLGRSVKNRSHTYRVHTRPPVRTLTALSFGTFDG